jgi:serine/threonine-protein kinase
MSLRREQWERVEALFQQAQDLDAASRRTFTDRLGGEDETVRREVAAMLLASEGTDELLDRPVAVVAPPFDGRIEEAASLAPGTLLGPWRVGERIGRGGMGEVFAAYRADGAFEAQAAVKVLKRGLDTDAVVARFLRERRIVARLAHPNIAHLLDAGATPDGRPYLVMERVQGSPITDHCARRQASVREVLGLMATVCDAVHEAHRQLVVHRDLKPSNVMLAEGGRIKVLDFGLAKTLPRAGDEREAALSRLSVRAEHHDRHAVERAVGAERDDGLQNAKVRIAGEPGCHGLAQDFAVPHFRR